MRVGGGRSDFQLMSEPIQQQLLTSFSQKNKRHAGFAHEPGQSGGLTQVDAASDAQKRTRHVVKRKGDVDDVLRRGSTHLEEGHADDGF